MKICTSQEQSKKLLELGVDVNTADMFYADILVDGNHKYNLHPLESYGFKTFGETKLKTSDHLSFIPAWSLTALMKLIPFQIITKNERYGFRQWKGYNTQGETYCFEYISSTNQRLYETYHWNNPLDAAFEMVCWLLAEKYI